MISLNAGYWNADVTDEGMKYGSLLKPANWLTLFAPAVLSLIAGATILAEPTLLGTQNAKIVASVSGFGERSQPGK